jgi:hypothetical protein
MSEADNIDTIRRATLERIEQTERHYKAAFYGAAILETLLLAGFLLLADFKSDRTHLLLLLATVGSYSILVLGLVALGAHVNRNSLRVLKAIELLHSRLVSGKQ